VGHALFREPLEGLRLKESDATAYRLPPEAGRFLRALPLLADASAVLYCEGSTDSHVARWCKQHALEPPPAKVPVGALLPASDCYHIPLEPALLDELAELVDLHRASVPCIHMHVYQAGTMLLEWYDAFLDDPLRLSGLLPPAWVAAFVAATG